MIQLKSDDQAYLCCLKRLVGAIHVSLHKLIQIIINTISGIHTHVYSMCMLKHCPRLDDIGIERPDMSGEIKWF
jgi:hypothetical protein